MRYSFFPQSFYTLKKIAPLVATSNEKLVVKDYIIKVIF